MAIRGVRAANRTKHGELIELAPNLESSHAPVGLFPEHIVHCNAVTCARQLTACSLNHGFVDGCESLDESLGRLRDGSSGRARVDALGTVPDNEPRPSHSATALKQGDSEKRQKADLAT